MAQARRRPVLGPYLGVIDEILAADTEAPPKQRHTAKRIFDRLRAEYGYTGCYSQVQTAVKAAKAPLEGSLRPAQPPARPCPVRLRRSQMVEIAGVRCKAALGVITLPYSDTYFLSAYPHECTETFQAGQWRASSSSGACRCGPPMTTPPSP